MPAEFDIVVDGSAVRARGDWTIAAAMLNAGRSGFRRAVCGEVRGPLCGMGICFECRVTVDGQSDVRACVTACRPGQEITTGAGDE